MAKSGSGMHLHDGTKESGRMTIEDWLKSIELGEYSSNFSKHHIDVDVLPCLTEADLIELGVPSLGHRKRMMNEATKLGSSNSLEPPEKKIGLWVYIPWKIHAFHWTFEGGSEAYILNCGKVISKVARSDEAFRKWHEENLPRKPSRRDGDHYFEGEFEDDSAREKYEAACSDFLFEASFRLLNTECMVAMDDAEMGKAIYLSADAFHLEKIKQLVQKAMSAFKKLDWKEDSKVAIIGFSRSRIGEIKFTEYVQWKALLEEIKYPPPHPEISDASKEKKVPCRICRALILPTTSTRTGGKCMPCTRTQNSKSGCALTLPLVLFNLIKN